jgi:shikimate dehydrogenase
VSDRPVRVRGSSVVTGVIGWPVSHSLSPVIHNAAFDALELDWVYVPLPVPPGAVPDALAGLRALGLRGANVTMPHKTEIAELVDDRSDDAERLRAVNTITVEGDVLLGDNTDAPGFDRFLRLDVGFEPAGRRALIFGAGGAARACALALARAELRTLTVGVREPARAGALREALDGMAAEVEVVSLEEATGVETDLIVNATPIGRAGDVLPLPPIWSETVAVDLLYRPATTPLQTAVREAGGVAFGGLGLLLHQAALSFERWTGQPAPLEVMSAAATAALAEAPDGPWAVVPDEPDPGGGRSAER